MTRKTRTRRPRIQSIQSGYCEICHIPYNSIDDHIQSKRHQKLIGEDAGYIAINGFLNQEANIESFLNLNNIDHLGNGLDNGLSSKTKRKNMPRTRAASVACDRFKEPVSPASSEIGRHHLRSRRQINYMTPPLDDDSLPESEKLDFSRPPRLSPTPTEFSRERLRSSARVLARLTEKNDEVWNSGRPKRSCLRARRPSTEEPLLAENPRTFYKVEKSRERDKAAKPAVNDKDVKFKKKGESSDEDRDDEDPNEDGANTTASALMLTSEEDETILPLKFKLEEDEASLDSLDLENRRRKKRRTHAEAFITDNHKYYKFEMPGSRLRYHGTFLPSDSIKSKSNGDSLKTEKDETRTREDFKLKLDSYKFSFETVPKNEQWYSTFKRQDLAEMRLPYCSNFYWDSFMMPYQMDVIPALDPKKCVNQFNQIKKLLLDPPSDTPSAGSSTPDHSTCSSTTSLSKPDVMDEDSKTSTVSTASCSSSVEDPATKKRKKQKTLSRTQSSKNPRKSPRQHASTLAILSSLLQQRKRKSKSLEDTKALPVIPEEPREKTPPPPLRQPIEEAVKASPRIRKKFIVCSRKPKACGRFKKKGAAPKVDYNLLASKIEDEINATLDLEENFEEIEPPEDCIDFNKGSINVSDILNMYDDALEKEDEKTTRRFFNSTPGRKPGKRKKKNLTGWPNNKHRRILKRVNGRVKRENEENSTNGSCSARNSDNDADTMNIAAEQSDQVTNDLNSVAETCDLRDRVDPQSDKILTVKITNSDFQPCVQKLNNEKIVKNKVLTPKTKRTTRRQRRMPGSPRSPRMLRKPRGRWYRER